MKTTEVVWLAMALINTNVWAVANYIKPSIPALLISVTFLLLFFAGLWMHIKNEA
jgi:hypothetical protein